MSIKDIINEFDSIKVNTISLEQKLQWIEDLENIARLSVLDSYEDIDRSTLGKESLDKEPLIKPPFQRLYILYMLAMLSFELDSTDEYNSYVDGYNYEMARFMDYVTRSKNVKKSEKIVFNK